ncbi:MAG: hypothetical protein Q8P67_25270 [archaeon]|nr:hypothetical protein [archaeon]
MADQEPDPELTIEPEPVAAPARRGRGRPRISGKAVPATAGESSGDGPAAKRQRSGEEQPTTRSKDKGKGKGKSKGKAGDPEGEQKPKQYIKKEDRIRMAEMEEPGGDQLYSNPFSLATCSIPPAKPSAGSSLPFPPVHGRTLVHSADQSQRFLFKNRPRRSPGPGLLPPAEPHAADPRALVAALDPLRLSSPAALQRLRLSGLSILPPNPEVAVYDALKGHRTLGEEATERPFSCAGEEVPKATIQSVLIHCGARISCLDWMAGVDSRGRHFAAVGLHSPARSGCVQVWDLGPLSPGCLPAPVLAMCLQHDHGGVLALRWLPRPAPRNAESLGLLAVVFSDGFCSVYCVPHPNLLITHEPAQSQEDTQSQERDSELASGRDGQRDPLLVLVRLTPVLDLPPAHRYALARCLDWQVTVQYAYLLVGHSDGSAKVMLIRDYLAPENDYLAEPIYACQNAKYCPLTAVTWFPEARQFVAADEFGTLSFWSISDPFLPRFESRLAGISPVLSLVWLSSPPGLLLATGKGVLLVSFNLSSITPLFPHVAEQANFAAPSLFHSEVAAGFENGLLLSAVLPKSLPIPYPRKKGVFPILALDCIVAYPDHQSPALVNPLIRARFDALMFKNPASINPSSNLSLDSVFSSLTVDSFSASEPTSTLDSSNSITPVDSTSPPSGASSSYSRWTDLVPPEKSPQVHYLRSPVLISSRTSAETPEIPCDPAVFQSAGRWSPNSHSSQFLLSGSHSGFLRLFSFNHSDLR